MFYRIVLLGTILECHYLERWQTTLLSRRKHSEFRNFTLHPDLGQHQNTHCNRKPRDVHYMPRKCSSSWENTDFAILQCWEILLKNPGSASENKTLVLWLNRRNLSTRFWDILPDQTKENQTVLLSGGKNETWLCEILQTNTSYENMNMRLNSRLNYIRRVFSAEQERGWSSWSLWSGTTCTKQFNVLLCEVKSRQVHIMCDCYNTGGHFPPRLCSTFILGAVQETAGLLGMVNHVGRDEGWGLSSSRLWSNTWGNVC